MQGQVIWFTGLSGSGKSTLCRSLEEELRIRDYGVQILDGDEMRKELCADLGFSTQDRTENIRRITCVGNLLAQNGIIVLVAAIAPQRSMRDAVRRSMAQFVEVFVDAPLSVCEQRDPKGLYKRARAGEIPDFTGLGSPYEPPLYPDVICHTDQEEIAQSTDKVLQTVLARVCARRSGQQAIAKQQLTIAVDFDGVIADYGGWSGPTMLGKPRADVVDVLRTLQEEGWKIVVHTTRCRRDIINYLQGGSIPFDEINKNSAYETCGPKPVATVYWDDRALRYSGDAREDLVHIRNFRTWSGRK
jgi:adenylylsulfate kinase